jgi:acetyltransferase-like isoleucine patch superfamily enzyme
LIARNFRIINHGRLTLARGGKYRFGTSFYGFMTGGEKSLIRVRGDLELQGSVVVAGGARWDVGPDARLTIGGGTYFSPNTLIVAANRITIGADCAIAWDVQIVDADFHAHGPMGGLHDSHHSKFTSAIDIGDNVWIGSNTKIYKGVSIANGCVIAGGSVVVKSISEPNSLIAGSPARIVKSAVEWK